MQRSCSDNAFSLVQHFLPCGRDFLKHTFKLVQWKDPASGIRPWTSLHTLSHAELRKPQSLVFDTIKLRESDEHSLSRCRFFEWRQILLFGILHVACPISLLQRINCWNHVYDRAKNAGSTDMDSTTRHGVNNGSTYAPSFKLLGKSLYLDH